MNNFMKTYILLYIKIVSILSFNGCAEKVQLAVADKKYD